MESHTVDEIEVANAARRSIRRRLRGTEKSISRKWSNINDERGVKRATTAYIQFSVSRQASGDFSHISLPERSKLIGQEWKALSEDEKQVRNPSSIEKPQTTHEPKANRYLRNTVTFNARTPSATSPSTPASTATRPAALTSRNPPLLEGAPIATRASKAKLCDIVRKPARRLFRAAKTAGMRNGTTAIQRGNY